MAATHTTNLLISALGGALGALILRSALKLVGAVWARMTPLAIHQYATSGAGPGEFDHCWGHQVDDKASTNGKPWEHDWNRIDSKPPHRAIGEHTLYGPYVNDFGKPGCYRVTFRLCGTHVHKSNEGVIALDAVQASFGTEKILRLLGQRIIKANELFGSYQQFDIVCYISGTDVYEYRCAVFRNADALASSARTIRFDCVKVYSHPPIWEIL